MPVTMSLRIAVHPARFEEAMTSDPQRLQTVADRARQYGATRHRFYAIQDGAEVLIVQEWPSPEICEQFFGDSPDFAQIIDDSGFVGELEPVYWQAIESPATF
jgi:hypothetical protein